MPAQINTSALLYTLDDASRLARQLCLTTCRNPNILITDQAPDAISTPGGKVFIAPSLADIKPLWHCWLDQAHAILCSQDAIVGVTLARTEEETQPAHDPI